MRLFGHHVAVATVSLAFFESALLFAILSGLLSVWGAIGDSNLSSAETTNRVMAGVIVMVLLATIAAGRYSRRVFLRPASGFSRPFGGLVLALLAAFVFLHVMDVIQPGRYEAYFGVAAIGILLQFPAAIVLPRVFLALVSTEFFRRRILFVCSGDYAAKLMEMDGHRFSGHFAVAGVIRVGEEPVDNHVTVSLPSDILEQRHALLNYVREAGVDEIVVATREKRGLPVRHLLECRFAGVRITDYATFWERESGQVDLDELQPSWLIFSDGFKTSWWRDAVKRLFDVTVSLAFLLFTLPLTLATAIAVRFDGKGPIFYRQERVGLHGHRFDVLKFRSMRPDAEKDGVPRWAGKSDDRITTVGRFIRKTRIDEIPQVLNVLKGDMSFVGPRPERPFFVEPLSNSIPFYFQRHQVKPGITGWAQVNAEYGASEEDAKTKLAFDLYYVKNNSLFLDFLILLQTVRVVLWSEGAR